MAWRIGLAVAAAVLFCTSLAQAGPVFGTDPSIVVELVPDNPGPYYGGEHVTADIYLHSRVPWDVYLRNLRVPSSGLLFALRFGDLHGEL